MHIGNLVFLFRLLSSPIHWLMLAIRKLALIYILQVISWDYYESTELMQWLVLRVWKQIPVRIYWRRNPQFLWQAMEPLQCRKAAQKWVSQQVLHTVHVSGSKDGMTTTLWGHTRPLPVLAWEALVLIPVTSRKWMPHCSGDAKSNMEPLTRSISTEGCLPALGFVTFSLSPSVSSAFNAVFMASWNITMQYSHFQLHLHWQFSHQPTNLSMPFNW